MKLFLDQIDVQCKNNIPTLVCWRGGVYPVEHILETWTSRTAWWSADEAREYMLLETTNGVMEVYRSANGWILSRLFD